ncbi:MAG: IclR family transcriptional regulator [Lachnospiraceae bacterium]|jgi:DNA-binding IclR family transcriptional regulator|nr:IclR family transcriptional regulator [Anaerocolumna sp.]MDF2610295.1 IclR family transcriptional regulator [Lachnospiraceae bacterium]
MAISRAAMRTINILELIASKAKGITLSEIAVELDMPVTSVNDIVKALIETDMIEIIDERSKLYGIGVKAYYIGNSFISNTSLVDKAKPIIEELATHVNKTVFLGKEVKDKITYIYKYEPKDTLIATCSIGSRTFLHTTSLGKCILANDEELLQHTIDKELIKKTSHSITEPDALIEELQKVRLKGYAVDNREQDEHLFCIGAPIYDHNNKVIAAISISGLYSENMNVEYEANLVREKALLISKKMGYTGSEFKRAIV